MKTEAELRAIIADLEYICARECESKDAADILLYNSMREEHARGLILLKWVVDGDPQCEENANAIREFVANDKAGAYRKSMPKPSVN